MARPKRPPVERDTYDPPDEEGGTVEPGDTVIELVEVDGQMVPHVYSVPEVKPRRTPKTHKERK